MANHNTIDCGILSREPHEVVVQLVRDKKLCFGCLKNGHSSNVCENRAKCKKCGKRHPTCLHQETSATNTAADTTTKPKLDTTSKGNTVTCGKITAPTSMEFTSSMIVPVWVAHKENPEKEILVYALLDTQSNASFILEQTCDALGCPTKQTSLKLTTMTSSGTSVDCRKVHNLIVRGLKKDNSIELPLCYTRQDIPIERSHIPAPSKMQRWSHLKSLSSELSEVLDCEVGLLIGYNCPEALAPTETAVGIGNEPFGIKTALGWSVVGAVDLRESADALGVAHRIMTRETKVGRNTEVVRFQTKSTIREKSKCELPEILSLLETDFKDSPDDQLMSQDDLAFLDILNQGLQQESDGHVSMPLPLRKRPQLPNSRPMAEKRLALLKRKLNHDPGYREQYTAFMDELIHLGHAEKVTTNKKDGEVWYIPHFGVHHPKKPDRLRVVFDCAARFREACLNDHLLKGPDLINTLLGVLLRFRLRPIAITCDIERMFHQFRVHVEDRDYLRFLWFDKSMETEEYRMTVHLFGATSSPGCATFGLRSLAEKYKLDHPEAAEFIKHSFYVDDGIVSVQTPEQAKQLVKQARDLCSKGGIHLHKFASNNRDVLESTPITERAKDLQDLDLSIDALPTERTLGIKWRIEDDSFQFSLNLTDKPPTRRGVLSGVASVFDPLGFVAPFVLTGKSILQACCKEKLSWDDPLPDDLKRAWRSWQSDLQDLHQASIPRCVSNWDLSSARAVELHHFGDASTNGYGACSYLRCLSQNGDIHCSFLMGKARVAPLKTTTMPRMELQAAVMAVKLSRLLRHELKLCDRVAEYFWTDSKDVLGYIQNDTCRFHVYVANRVQKIKETTSTNQWNYIPSEDNPADLASRGAAATQLINSDWLTGPRFLWQEQLPLNQVEPELSPTDPEVRKCLRVSVRSNADKEQTEMWDTIVNKHSTLVKASSHVATLLKAISRFKRGDVTDAQLLQQAVQKIIQVCQSQTFGDEIEALKAGIALSTESQFSQLDPFLDSDGLLRVGGRLRQAELNDREKHPIILPRSSHITELIAASCHKKTAHGGRTLTMNQVRQEGYWIINLNKVVTSLIRRCVTCRKLRSPTAEQKMADLPKDRTNPSPPPFWCLPVTCLDPLQSRRGERSSNSMAFYSRACPLGRYM